MSSSVESSSSPGLSIASVEYLSTRDLNTGERSALELVEVSAAEASAVARLRLLSSSCLCRSRNDSALNFDEDVSAKSVVVTAYESVFVSDSPFSADAEEGAEDVLCRGL